MSYGKVWIYSNNEKYSGIIVGIQEPRMRGKYISPVSYPSDNIQEEELEFLTFLYCEIECYDLPHTIKDKDIDRIEIYELSYSHNKNFEYDINLDVEKIYYDYNAGCLVIKAW